MESFLALFEGIIQMGNDIFKFINELNCRELHFYNDEDLGLNAIIAIHNTNLGPSLGGCRCFPYASTYDAVVDVVRLAQGMSFKSAAAGLNLGGGKAVIICEPDKIKRREDFFKAFGKFVESLNGEYITAVDMGSTSQDMDNILTQTKHVTSHNSGHYAEKDPSPITALGVLRSMQATAKHMNGKDSLSGMHVNIQGLGHVGYCLAGLLVEQGATVKGFDVNKDNLARAAKEFGIDVANDLSDVLRGECDIFAPCATGAILSAETIPKLKAKAVVGAANNQLKYPDDAALFAKHNIVYAPDFVVNAGGIIYVAGEYFADPESTTMAKIDNLYNIILSILDTARDKNQDTQTQAYAMADARLKQ